MEVVLLAGEAVSFLPPFINVYDVLKQNVWSSHFAKLKIQLTLVISTSIISNDRLSRRENLVLI